MLRTHLLTTTSDPHLAVDKDVPYGIGPNARWQTLDVVYHKDATKRPPAIVLDPRRRLDLRR